MAATFTFALSASSKAEHIPQRHTDTRRQRQDTDMTHHRLPSAALIHKTQVKQIEKAKNPSSSLASRDSSSLVQAYTHSILQVHKHVQIPGNSTNLAPLSAQQPCLGPRTSYLLPRLPTHHLVQLEVLSKHTQSHTHPSGTLYAPHSS